MKKIIICLLALAVVFTLISCSDEEEYYTVTFDSNGGSKVTGLVVVEGSTVDSVVATNKTVREGYAFTGWYSDANCKNLWVKGTPINSNTTIYAGWDDSLVSFNSTEEFTVTPNGTWEGTIEYSFDGCEWTTVVPATAIEVNEDSKVFDDYAVFFRGSDNTVITGATGNAWVFSSAVYCNGDIRALLEYKAVSNPSYKSIEVGEEAFEEMFKGQPILSAPYIEKVVSGTEADYMKEMFCNCTNLTVSLTKPADVEYQKFNCTEYTPETYYKDMFKGMTDACCDTPSTTFTYYIYESSN